MHGAPFIYCSETIIILKKTEDAAETGKDIKHVRTGNKVGYRNVLL